MAIKIRYKIWLMLIACSLASHVALLHAVELRVVDLRPQKLPITITLIDAQSKATKRIVSGPDTLLDINSRTFAKIRAETAEPRKHVHLLDEFTPVAGESYGIFVTENGEITVLPYSNNDVSIIPTDDFDPEF